jgi:hypothetical protein
MGGTNGGRQRPVERYRDAIARYGIEDCRPERPLRSRDRLIDKLTEEIRPFLEAILEVEGAEDRLARSEGVMRRYVGSSLSVVANLERIRAQEERREALATLRELMRDEETILRYVLLRQLLRFQPANADEDRSEPALVSSS